MKRENRSHDSRTAISERRRGLRVFRDWCGSSVGSVLFHAILLCVLFIALRNGSQGGLGKTRNTDEIGIVLSNSQSQLDDLQVEVDGGAESQTDFERRQPYEHQNASNSSLQAESSVFLPSNEIGVGAANPTAEGDLLKQLSASSSTSTSTALGQVVGFGGAKGSGRKFVYVLDHSDSMSWRGGRPMRRALAEAVASVRSLDPKQGANKFQILVFNHDVDVFRNGTTLIDVTPQNKAEALKFLNSVTASGGTAPEQALAKALAMKPDVVFFLTDADEELSEAALVQIRELRRANNVKQISVIEFGQASSTRKRSFRRLAAENGGDYVFRDVDQM